MTDAQSLLAILALIYLSDCLLWVPRDAIVVVMPLRGRAFVRLPSTWAANDRGALVFTALLPPRALFLCEPSEAASVAMRDLDERVAGVLRLTRPLHRLGLAVFVAMFLVAPLLSLWLGFARIVVAIFIAFLVTNVIVSIVFFRTFGRVDPHDRARRLGYGVALLVAPPSASRAVDQVTLRALRDFEPLAVAARLAGEDDPNVRRLLRELAHPAGGGPPDPRYETARALGLEHRDQAPKRAGGAVAYCPRCLVQFGVAAAECPDCHVSLQPL